MTQAADPIPAIREEDASGEIAAIYADLRATLGVPFVNLIWRHIATIPGGLAWTWTLARPLYLARALDDAAAELHAGLNRPEVPPINDFVLACAGLDEADRAAIRALIGDYNRANGVNFLALLVALIVLAGEHERPSDSSAARLRAEAVPSSRPETPAVPGPRLLGLDELSPPLLALVRDLDGFGRIEPGSAVASLYRHLGHWPAFLALARTALLPLQRQGALRAAQERTIVRGRILAAGLAPLVAVPALALDPSAQEQVRSALEAFTGQMIGRMIVMGDALLGLLPEPSA